LNYFHRVKGSFEYELCLSVVDAQTLQPLPTSVRQPVCRQFRTQTPQAPRLLSPQNGQAVMQPFPQFSWTPTFFVSGRTALYVVTVCKILPGQTPRQALEGNVPLVKSDPQQGTSFSYPATAEQLDQIPDAASFVWQVQAVDENGTPIGENNGKSEIFTFLPPKSSAVALTKPSSTTAASTTLSPSSPPSAPAVIFPANTISGIVQVNIGGTRVAGADMQVSLQAASERGATVAVAETDAQGRFTLRTIATKSEVYTLRVRGRGVEQVVSNNSPFTLGVGEKKEGMTLTVEMPSYQAQLTLVDAENKPISGARVKVARPSGVFALKGEPALNLNATSNSAGVATLSGLLPSSNVQDFYVAEIQADGYKAQKIYLQSTKTSVVSERIRLERAGLRVFGVVRQGTNAVANAAVHLVSDGKTVFQSLSDNDGTYTIDVPASVIAGLSAQVRSGLSVVAVRGDLRGEGVPVRPAGEAIEVNPSLPTSTTTFTGLVVSVSNGRTIGLSGATVRDAATGNSATTDAQGRFSLNASGSKVSVIVSRAGFEDKEVAIVPQGNEIALTPRGNWLQVTVLDKKTTKPIVGATVVLIDNAGKATTDAQGTATLKGFPQYARSLTVYAAGYGVETLDFLPASGLTGEPVTVRLSAGGVVTGTVNDEGGKPVGDATVSLVGYENVLEVQTTADGKFKLDNVPTGEMRIVARAAGFVSAKQDLSIAVGLPQDLTLSLKKLSVGITSVAGFDARIDAMREEGDALVISGVLTNLKPSKNFASLVPNVQFQQVKVSKSSAATGNALPIGGTFSLVERELPMKFANEFPVKARNINAGEPLEIVLERPSDAQGVLKGSVHWQLQEYVSDVAAGARADVEEVGILVAKPLLGKDGAETAFSEEHALFTAAPLSLAQTSEDNEYRTACRQTPTITVGGVTLAVVCDNFTVDVQNRNASFGARATLPENPLGIDTLTINPVRMGKTWGFQSAEIQFSGNGLSIPLASSGWRMGLQRISITNTGVKIGGTITVSVAPSIPVNGIAFSDVGVALGGVSGGTFSMNPRQFDLYGITTISAPQLSIAIAGDSITVRVANGQITLTDADWRGLTIPTFQFTRRLDSLRRKPNLPAFNAPTVNVRANNLRRPSFPGLGKIAAQLKGIVSVELSGIDFTEQNELTIDGSVAFQFPGLQVQAGNFLFGKNKFVVREFGFALDVGKLYAGMKMRYLTTPRTRFEGEARVLVGKTGTGPNSPAFLGLDASIMYESRTVWSVDFMANIPPIQLIPVPPPGVPIYLSGIGGGLGRDNSVFRISITGRLQMSPASPPPMEITLGVDAQTNGVITGRVNSLAVVGQSVGNGSITIDFQNKDVTGNVNLGFSKASVTATGTVNFEVRTSKNEYFIDANTNLNVGSYLSANGRFYYGVKRETKVIPIIEKRVTIPSLPPGTPPALVDQLAQTAQVLSDLAVVANERVNYTFRALGGAVKVFRSFAMSDFLNQKSPDKWLVDVLDQIVDAVPDKKSATEQQITRIVDRILSSMDATQVHPKTERVMGETIQFTVGHHWMADFMLDNKPPNPTRVLTLAELKPGRDKLRNLLIKTAYIFALTGLDPNALTPQDVQTGTRTETTETGGLILDVRASLSRLSRSIDFGLGSASCYGWADGAFSLKTSPDFKTGSGAIAISGGAGFSVRVIKLNMSADAAYSGSFNLNYSPTATTFNGNLDCSLSARVGGKACCRNCSANCNSIDVKFLCGEARACVGLRANYSYNGSSYAGTLSTR
jgi:hypothetical protein